MPVSGTTTFSISRDSIIAAALRGLHEYGATDIIPAEDITFCAEALNIMVKAWAAKGLMVWCVNEVTIPTVASQAVYNIGPTATGTGAVVTNRPMKIISAFIRSAANVDVGINVESRFDYNTVDNKATTGAVNQLFYDPQVGNGSITLSPVPVDALSTIHIIVQRQAMDFNLSTDTPDFPQEFYRALKWGLMDEVALEYEASLITTQIVAAKSKEYFAEAMHAQDVDAKDTKTTLSTTSLFGVNRDSIIQDALIEIGKYSPSDKIPSTDITHCARAMNVMIKAWAIKGMPIWCIGEVVMPLVAAKASYTMGPASTTPDFVTPRPMRIISAFLRDNTGNDVELTVTSRFDYNMLGNKTSPGQPNQLYYDPQLNKGVVTLYDVPADALSSIHFIVQRQITEFNLSADNPDFPQEFYQALKWGLMDEIALGYKAPAPVIQMAAMKAKQYVDEQMDFAQEQVSVFFQPRFQ